MYGQLIVFSQEQTGIMVRIGRLNYSMKDRMEKDVSPMTEGHNREKAVGVGYECFRELAVGRLVWSVGVWSEEYFCREILHKIK